MELKITADKKLLEAMHKLADALLASGTASFDAGPCPTPDPEPGQKPPADALLASGTASFDAGPCPTPDPEPGQKPPAAPDPRGIEPSAGSPSAEAPGRAFTREEVQRIGIRKVQAGKRAAVKALVEKYGGRRVSEIPGEKLTAFAVELEAL